MTATTTLCVVCERPTDATACHQCALRLAQTLREAAGHAEDAGTVLARLARHGAAEARLGRAVTAAVTIAFEDNAAETTCPACLPGWPPHKHLLTRTYPIPLTQP
jgi:hypothetical protein